MNKEIQLQGATYRIGALDVFEQLHLVRKMLPAAVELFKVQLALGAFKDGSKDIAHLLNTMLPLAEVISKMSKEDSEFMIYSCLNVISKGTGNNQFAPVKASGTNALMDNTITLAVVLALVKEVIQQNLGNFSAVVALLLPEAVATTDSSL